MKHQKGLIIGKFMPPHKGHEYIIRFAKECCEELTVVVDCLSTQTIEPELRKKWIEELIPGITVIALDEFMPQDPSETPDFWPIWINKLKSVAGQPDVLIASMDYGWELSERLGCEFIQCDIARESVPICATKIRDNPFKYWDFIVESARGFFMTKICLIGPESTGKSEVVKALAKHFNTVFVPEYAKAIIDSQKGEFHLSNVVPVGLAQIRTEKALERMTNKFMFCDSDVITTMVWSEELFGVIPDELIEIAKKQHYDHTYLCYPDTQWKSDTHRDVSQKSSGDDFRLKMFHRMEELLNLYNRHYSVIQGYDKERIIADELTKKYF